jgi:hypothetical protein
VLVAVGEATRELADDRMSAGSRVGGGVSLFGIAAPDVPAAHTHAQRVPRAALLADLGPRFGRRPDRVHVLAGLRRDRHRLRF